MTTINLQATHNSRIEWVQSHIRGLFDLPHHPEKYNAPEKWEGTISLLMSTGARDFDAKRHHPNSAEHAAEALNRLKKSNILTRLTTPLSEVSHITFAREMANLIVEAADTIDNTITNQAEEEPIKEIKESAQDTTTYNHFNSKAIIVGIVSLFILIILFTKYGI
jgi:hypothetical protein